MSDAAISLFEVTKRFGAKTAVDSVSFTVDRGSCYGLIGPNGAGKTTSFAMICGYLYANAGKIDVLGVDPSVQGTLKGKLGALPQDAVLPPQMKVGALLTYYARLSGLAEPEREARGALEKVGLTETWDVRAGALSHGMAKRISLAQALLGTPPIVLLDEPTAGLDPRIAAQIRQIIREMKGKQTVVVSSHNLHELEELCDGAAILDRGKVAQAGTMAELTRAAAEFRVQIAKGDVPLPEVKQLKGVTGAALDPSGSLLVQYEGTLSAEDAITEVVTLLVHRGVKILEIRRGRRLEDRVLQLT